MEVYVVWSKDEGRIELLTDNKDKALNLAFEKGCIVSGQELVQEIKFFNKGNDEEIYALQEKIIDLQAENTKLVELHKSTLNRYVKKVSENNFLEGRLNMIRDITNQKDGSRK